MLFFLIVYLSTQHWKKYEKIIQYIKHIFKGCTYGNKVNVIQNEFKIYKRLQKRQLQR